MIINIKNKYIRRALALVLCNVCRLLLILDLIIELAGDVLKSLAFGGLISELRGTCRLYLDLDNDLALDFDKLWRGV